MVLTVPADGSFVYGRHSFERSESMHKTPDGMAPMDARERAVASIDAAKVELEHALSEIDMIQTFNPALIGLVAHALSNYISVTTATVEMLQLTLRGHQDPDVAIWLEGVGHTADLMQHSVGRLVSMSAPRDFPLKLDRVNG